MDRKELLIVIGIVIIIGLALVMVNRQPIKGPISEIPAIEVRNFEFSETQTGPENFTLTTTLGPPGSGSVAFEGPVMKPTPCNGLSATYEIKDDDVIVKIEATPYEGVCIQVIANTFYRGSFGYTGDIDEIVVIDVWGGELGREKL